MNFRIQKSSKDLAIKHFIAEFLPQMDHPKVKAVRLCFLSLPREIRQQIMLEIFPTDERDALVKKLTLGHAVNPIESNVGYPLDFWTTQERGFLVTSFYNAMLPGPKRILEQRLKAEIAKRADAVMLANNCLHDDMRYIRNTWSKHLNAAVAAWCTSWRSQHIQIKGAGPGEYNWWWVPIPEDETWYQSMMEDQSASDTTMT